MHTVKITISYDGTGYKGWQVQSNGKTIQGELERAAAGIFGKKVRIHGASRTDSGVHARGQVAHFKTSIKIPSAKMPKAFNSLLPGDIAVLKAEYVDDDFHSRFDAKSKNYRYFILNSRKRDPLNRTYVRRLPYKLNVPLMKEEIRALLGRHDFKAFQARDKKERSSIRNIMRLTIGKRGSLIVIDIEADGFLYNMVRNIVGTLIDIGRGHLPPGSMKKILANRDRSQAGPTAPASGLFLMKVNY